MFRKALGAVLYRGWSNGGAGKLICQYIIFVNFISLSVGIMSEVFLVSLEKVK